MNRPRAGRCAVAAAALALALPLSGCASDSESDPVVISTAPAPTSADVPATDAPVADAPVADAAVTTEDRCTDDELSLNAGREEGSAGSVTIPLVFTNVGDRDCVLSGFPGVSYVTAEDGTEVGAAASRSGPDTGGVPVRQGGRAAAVVRAVQVLNYPEAECEPTPVAGLRVYPPNGSQARFVALPGTGCALPGVDQLQVTAVAAR